MKTMMRDSAKRGLFTRLPLLHVLLTAFLLAAFPAIAADAAPAGPLYADGLRSDADLWDWLSGPWEFLPGGQPLRLEPCATLYFDRQKRTAIFTRESDKQYLEAQVRTGNLHDRSRGGGDLITLIPKDISGAFSALRSQMLGSKVDFQVVASQAGSRDLLALREIGNGESAFAMDGLKYDSMASDG
ncbi:MAG: hypothetical protein J5855_07415, partial [Mailhella sp.]|nr:hypothetical protein [Mailhella sp.]